MFTPLHSAIRTRFSHEVFERRCVCFQGALHFVPGYSVDENFE
jgi:hypothetical protein